MSLCVCLIHFIIKCYDVLFVPNIGIYVPNIYFVLGKDTSQLQILRAQKYMSNL